MKATKLEIYLPPNLAELWPAFRQYLAPHVLHIHYTTRDWIVALAEKSTALDRALSSAIAYAESKTSTPILVVTIPCTIIKE